MSPEDKKVIAQLRQAEQSAYRLWQESCRAVEDARTAESEAAQVFHRARTKRRTAQWLAEDKE